MIDDLRNKISAIDAMNLEDWYDSLNRDLKMKLIRFKSLKKNSDYLSLTNAETAPIENNDEKDDDDDENDDDNDDEVEYVDEDVSECET